MIDARLFLKRDTYGVCVWASFSRKAPADLDHRTLVVYRVNTTKQIVNALLQVGTRKELFDAAWRKAISGEGILRSRCLDVDDGEETITFCVEQASILDIYAAELVNKPTSKFYIWG